MKRILSLGIGLVAVALGTNALAAPFGSTNLVIYRLGGDASGNTSVSLTNAGTVVWLDEYYTNGTFRQSHMMRTNYFGANSPLIDDGTAFGNGLITRSVDGRFIVVAGYGATLGQFSTSLGTSYATQAPRVIAVVGGNGNIDTTTTLTNNASGGSSGGEIRSVVSPDGTNIWTSGDALSAGGMQYTTRGSSDATVLSAVNTRQLRIYSNQIYLTSASLTSNHIAQLLNTNDVNTLPTATNNVAIVDLPGTTNPPSPWAFVAFKLNAGGADPIDTLYVADGSNFVYKLSKVGTTWSNDGSIRAGSPIGLTGQTRVIGSITNVDLWITGGGGTLSGNDNLSAFTDPNGYHVAVSGNANLNILTTSANSTSFRGITFAPVGSEALCPGLLSVGPVFGFSSSGGACDPFTPSNTCYSIANVGSNAVNWAASADVNWLTISPASGSLSSLGSITATVSLNANANSLVVVSNYTATITFANTSNHAGDTTRPVSLNISALMIITSQPQSLTVCSSNSAVFSVTASGCAPLFYQWQKDETNLTDGGNVSGSTTDVLTLNPTTISDAGNYRVIITNAYGSVTSSNATLTVDLSINCSAIQNGLACLVSQQNTNGSWSGGYVAYTGFAVTKLEERAFELGFASPFDDAYQYKQNVINGLNYLFSQAGTYGLGTGICFSKGANETYNNGVAMMAIAASRATNSIVNVPGSIVNGMTFKAVLQSNVAYFAWSQNTDGGWGYVKGSRSDNSNSGYVVLGLRHAEAPIYGFACTIPAALKAGLNNWISAIQVSGGANDGGSQYTVGDGTANLLRTGNLLFEMSFVGDNASVPRVQRAIAYIENHWNDNNEEPGWRPHNYQAMNCLAEGFRSLCIGTITVGGTNVDWFAQFATAILASQQSNGCWPANSHGDVMLSTEWALLVLEECDPPAITCPANIVLPNALCQCSSNVAFAVTAPGCPAPAVVCMIGSNAITSPHTFPVGTTTVNCTASNDCGIATCSFTVTVLTEFQQWQLYYFGCTNCAQAAAHADPDGDGMSNIKEFLAGFNPTNSAAYLHVISIVETGDDINVTYLGADGDSNWTQCVQSRTNILEYSTGNPADGSYSNNFLSAGQTNILSGGTGLGTVTNMVDSGGATNVPSRYYRVRVLVP